uniref:Uncharacterized protein n=1 Tax=Oryza glumipatula TaxID=40148 RepID=A0A0E0B304_9ORYZ
MPSHPAAAWSSAADGRRHEWPDRRRRRWSAGRLERLPSSSSSGRRGSRGGTAGGEAVRALLHLHPRASPSSSGAAVVPRHPTAVLSGGGGRRGGGVVEQRPELRGTGRRSRSPRTAVHHNHPLHPCSGHLPLLSPLPVPSGGARHGPHPLLSPADDGGDAAELARSTLGRRDDDDGSGPSFLPPFSPASSGGGLAGDDRRPLARGHALSASPAMLSSPRRC